MRKYDHIVFQIWMRVILGLLFLLSILFKLGLELDYLTTQVVAGEGATWMNAPWIVRGLLTGEIIIFLLIIFLKFGKGFQSLYFLIIVLLWSQHILTIQGRFEGDYGLLSFCNISFESGAGFLISPSYLVSLFAAITFTIVGFFSTRIKENYPQLKWYYSLAISVAFIVGIQSVEVPDMKDFKASNSTPVASAGVWNPFIKRLYKDIPELSPKKALLCSFSVTCSHCNEYAKRINAQFQAEKNVKKAFNPIVFLFYTDLPDKEAFQEEVDAFMSRNLETNKSLISVLILNRSEMLNLTGREFPVFTVLENGKVIKMMISDQFNYFERDAFFNSSDE
jgi:hypothetical protein